MKIVIPMAGIGERFIKAGYEEPKPLIKVDGKPVIEHVANIFPGEDDFVFICREDHLETTDMYEVLRRIKPNGKIVSIKPHKLGPVWTVLEGLKKEDFIQDDQPLIVNYADFNVWWNYEDFKKTVAEKKCNVAVTAYLGFHPHILSPSLYASMKVNENNWMLECREKFSFTENKMDSFQQSGTFYFSNGALLKKYFNEVVHRQLLVNGEYYISAVTQTIAEDNFKVYVYTLENFLQWGTPEDLQTYQFWSDYFALKAGEKS